MEKSEIEISTDHSLSSYHISGTFTHIISLRLHENYDRHICPHFVGELQMGQVSKSGRGVVSRAGLGPCTLCPSALQPPPARCQEHHPMQGWGGGVSLPLFLLLMHWLFQEARGFPARPPALVFNYKHHLLIECLHIRAN